MNKGMLNQLLEIYGAESLESHLIYSYLVSNKLNFKTNDIILKTLHSFIKNDVLFNKILNLNISNVKKLENCLELIIPANDRKLNGAFFTPDYIIDHIINEIKPKENDKNLDPSCGCGAFLIGLIDYYSQTFSKPIKNILRENIFGADILDYNIKRSKIILTIYALQNGENIEEGDLNLYHQDSLRTEWKINFDNIVGNPPYVKFQDIADENRNYLSKNCSTIDGGNFNLYFAFFELGYNLLKPNGKLGYITPNNYFTSLSGESLRKYFHQKKCLAKIIDFSHKKVFDAQTYTAITFIDKQQNDFINYDKIKDFQAPEIFLKNINYSKNYLDKLNVKKWRLLKTEEQENIQTIETIGSPIGKLFDICVGIATLKDDIFFIDGSKERNNYYLKITENGVFEIEKDIVKPVYKISDFKTQEDIEKNTRKIIFPYSVKNKTAIAIPEDEFSEKYPRCYAYLLSEKATLLSRDKGKINFDPFYVWGRTQGLTKVGKKILNPTFSQHPRFLMVEEDAFFTNGYGIYFKEQKNGFFSQNPIGNVENIDVVQKILNSFVMDYYVSTTSSSIEGGYPCYQKNFIEKFTIPELTQDEIETIRYLKTSEEIDDFLISKYHLNLLAGNLLV